MDSLPFISADLPGLGGRLKACPEHFVVQEIPLYEPAGEGSHLYLTLKRAGFTTREVVDDLAKRFELKAGEVGYAGLKDKEAVTTQTFSLPLTLDFDQVRTICQGASWEIIALSRHGNKLKVGHLLGNRFTIVLTEPQGSLAQGLAIAEVLRARGVPNYFGKQRFGRDGDNHEAGLALLKAGRRGRSWRDKFLLSALQSFIFNHYLARRIEDGLFETVLTGDICKKYATGGLFVSDDGEVETGRLMAGELSPAGPIFGSKMKATGGVAAEFEARVLEQLNITRAEADRTGSGDRRINRLLLPNLSLEEGPDGFIFNFSLPKGAYATSVLREFDRWPS